MWIYSAAQREGGDATGSLDLNGIQLEGMRQDRGAPRTSRNHETQMFLQEDFETALPLHIPHLILIE